MGTIHYLSGGLYRELGVAQLSPLIGRHLAHRRWNYKNPSVGLELGELNLIRRIADKFLSLAFEELPYALKSRILKHFNRLRDLIEQRWVILEAVTHRKSVLDGRVVLYVRFEVAQKRHDELSASAHAASEAIVEELNDDIVCCARDALTDL